MFSYFDIDIKRCDFAFHGKEIFLFKKNPFLTNGTVFNTSLRD